MLMLAILALGMLSFTIGKAAVLRSGAQTAADAAALAGARSIRDQLIAQVATTGTSDFARVSYPIVRAAAADYAKRNDGRLTDLKMEGADVRAYVTTDEKIDPPKEDREGKATARARVELAAFTPTIGVPGGPGGRADRRRHEHLRQGVEGARQEDRQAAGLRRPADARPLPQGPRRGPALRELRARRPADAARRRARHDVLPLQVRRRLGRDRPQLRGQRVLDHRVGEAARGGLGFSTIWQAPNHYDHMHIDISNSGAIGGGPLGGAAGPLWTRSSRSSSSTGTRPRRSASAPGSWAGRAASRSGRPIPGSRTRCARCSTV